MGGTSVPPFLFVVYKYAITGEFMIALVDIGIGVLILGVAALILGVGIKLIKESLKKEGRDE